ncbi:hypothetical protein [Scytonema sp. NUACC26]|uniref:hypothetical protein n=1 Tax=Scytonema sp. NUACC26 TaxID=3140176 RepID=UPI0038B3DB37
MTSDQFNRKEISLSLPLRQKLKHSDQCLILNPQSPVPNPSPYENSFLWNS